MRYLFIGATVAILLLAACGPAATSETVPTPLPVTPTLAQTTFDSPLPGTTPLPTVEPPIQEDTGKGVSSSGEGQGEGEPTRVAGTVPKDERQGDVIRAAAGDDWVIIYERSGGFTGIMQTYEIYADGHIVVRDGDTEIKTCVSPNDVQTALTRIEELGFFDLSAPSGPVNASADRIVHTLIVKRDGKPMTVRTVDGATDEPAGMREAIEMLNRLIAGESP